ncbi:hypothetical protein NA57DRAFT_31416 [Rhizodiscina lignyota]|uniref:Amidohydrolase-related domain-containing protein n=1 Tax=Rhizodiscina lignyota TaxID=1504668 RepID=A0A9P4IS86_9PEZI|nr:hypothetical protein NA57DRAFT_31416 [Rhizodiscina lignyota]
MVDISPRDNFVVTDVLIFDGSRFIERGYVVVGKGKICDVGEGTYEKAHDDIVPVYSMPDHTVLPGLIDAHIHGLGGNPICLEQSLNFGVTTVCDMHNGRGSITKLQQFASDPANKSRFADFKSCGMGATISGGWPEPVMRLHAKGPNVQTVIDRWPKLQSPHDADPFVQEQVEQCGAEYIKLFHELGDSLKNKMPSTPSLELQRALIEAAHAHGLPAVGHAFSFEGMLELLQCGIDGLMHAPLDKARSDDYVGLFKEKKAFINPTLTCLASQSSAADELQRRFHADPFAQKMLFNTKPRKNLAMGGESAHVQHGIDMTRKLYENGVPIVVGSDSSGQASGQQFGLTMHMEMHLLAHEVDMKPIDVLKSSTSTTADRFGFTDRGSLDVGKKADLILINGDVRDVMEDEQNLCLPIRAVWRDGVLDSRYDQFLE